MSDQGVTLVAFIDSQYEAEETRRTQLNDAASKQLTTSAAFVALIVAVASLALGRDFSVASGADSWAVAARGLVLTGTGAFAVSGMLASMVQAVRPIEVASGEAMDQMLQAPVWKYTEVQARNLKAIHVVRTTKSMREANATRANYYKASGWVQLLAVAIVLAAVFCAFVAQTPPTTTPTQIVCIGGPCASSTGTAAPAP